jgi:hypothetical protein
MGRLPGFRREPKSREQGHPRYGTPPLESEVDAGVEICRHLGIPVSARIPKCLQGSNMKPSRKQDCVYRTASKRNRTLYIGVTFNLPPARLAAQERLHVVVHEARGCPHSRVVKRTVRWRLPSHVRRPWRNRNPVNRKVEFAITRPYEEPLPYSQATTLAKR